MKTILKWIDAFLCIVICLIMATSFISCGDDEPENTVDNDNSWNYDDNHGSNLNDFTYIIGVPVYSNYYISETGLYYYTLGIGFGGDDLWNNHLKEFGVKVDVATGYDSFTWRQKMDYGSVSRKDGKPFFIGDVANSPRGTNWEGEIFVESNSNSITLKITPYWKFKNSSSYNMGATVTRVIQGKK